MSAGSAGGRAAGGQPAPSRGGIAESANQPSEGGPCHYDTGSTNVVSTPRVCEAVEYCTLTPSPIHRSHPHLSTDHTLTYPQIRPSPIHRSHPHLSTDYILTYPQITPSLIYRLHPYTLTPSHSRRTRHSMRNWLTRRKSGSR